MHDIQHILGIESSCDETAVALVRTDGIVLGEALMTQFEDHLPYGGVVPEIAARQHMLHVEPLIRDVLERTQCSLQDVDAVAVTAGPGLIGGVIVGVMMAKAVATVLRVPIYAINHLEAHALSVRIHDSVAFPYLLFLMSGGHCQIMVVHDVGSYELFGATLDDAIGEAFDKTAKMLGLGYPGGREIERLAKDGDPHRFAFPLPYIHRAGCDMSFSGLKTAVRTQIIALDQAGGLSAQDKADIAASVQHSLCTIILNRMDRALALCKERAIPVRAFVVAGGVAANGAIRQGLQHLSERASLPFVAPPMHLCTDNATMIAWAGLERIRRGIAPSNLDFEPKARWSLTDM
ncbi:MAG: tRNA (adenosine(37)-N6)-threonylcarbamoyltransferase complex transferase subunit TsaD [Candidatus Kapaibacterium sp.]|nr:MAG: tRNA (adenosine(37)-N6)-threonylcarbamoyltransferase complex transferase subunit TsaD [Candidatus Kapabacteria bacterium]